MIRNPPRRLLKKPSAELSSKEVEGIAQIDKWRANYANGLSLGSLADRADLIRTIIYKCHGDSSLHLEVLCAAMGYSMRSLERKFRALYGMSMSQYQKERRLDRAKLCIENNPTMKIDALAVDLGYSTENEFRRFFRGKTGMAPKDYAQSVINKRKRPPVEDLVE
jgi:AraC-like DNA-binding protein